MLDLNLCACQNTRAMMMVGAVTSVIVKPKLKINYTHFVEPNLLQILDAIVEYKKVATPSLMFRENKFVKFDLKILHMPGAKNVPIGDLKIGENKIPCNCSLVKVTIVPITLLNAHLYPLFYLR